METWPVTQYISLEGLYSRAQNSLVREITTVCQDAYRSFSSLTSA